MRHPLAAALTLAVAARIALWLVAAAYPIPNEDQQLISPLRAYSDIDLTFYQLSREYYRIVVTAVLEVGDLQSIPEVIDVLRAYTYAAPPLLPLLLEVFQFGPENPLPMTVFYLLLAILVAAFWVKWLHDRNVGFGWLVVFALLPVPYWFMLNVSSDLPFAALVTVFFFFAFESRKASSRLWGGLIFATLALTTRAHGVVLLAYLAGSTVLNVVVLPKRAMISVLVSIGIILGLSAYLLTGYVEDYLRTGNHVTYFTIAQKDYLTGIYPSLPGVLDRGLSVLSLLGAKFFYLTGLRPSWWHTPLELVLVRAAGGIILLPGIVYLAVRGQNDHRLFVLLFILPLLLGAAQERYLLGIIPLLFYYGVLAWSGIVEAIGRYTSRARAMFGDHSR